MNDADVAAIINAPKACPNCDKQLVRPAKMNAYAWAKKIYCNASCYRRALKNGKHMTYQFQLEGRYIGP
ncbi:MAG: hypothetical protein EOO40_00370 [Deltaproteobacteria bacterium]|nr:MAG: hypothetical protein EOO40_00370 [Deltaproteobacteria bacterium]